MEHLFQIPQLKFQKCIILNVTLDRTSIANNFHGNVQRPNSVNVNNDAPLSQTFTKHC